MFDQPATWSQLAPFCLAVGAVSGLLGGLLGIGGGIVIVPSLLFVFDALGWFPDNTVQVALATSLGVVCLTSTSAAATQIRARKVLWPIVRRWGPWLVLGGFLAGTVAAALPEAAVRTIIGTFLLFVAIVMLTRWQPHPHRTFPPLLVAAPLGLAGGLIAGLAGIAGGNVVVPTLLYFNTPVHNATATSSALGVPIALAGVLGYIVDGWSTTRLADGMIGHLHYPTFLTIVVTAVVAAPLGVKLAHRVNAVRLRRVFGACLVPAALRLLLG